MVCNLELQQNVVKYQNVPFNYRPEYCLFLFFMTQPCCHNIVLKPFLPFFPLRDQVTISIAIKFFLKFGFTPCKPEQPLQGMELQEKEAKKV